MMYEMPVLNILGREVGTFEELQKTLAQFGLNNGSGLLRMSFRQTDQPLEEAMKVRRPFSCSLALFAESWAL